MFFKSDEEEKKVAPQQPSFRSEPPLQFRSQVATEVKPSVSVSSKVKETYETEFKKIDTPGIDYFEFHNGVMKAGVSKQSVEMMYNLLESMSPTMSKDIMKMQAQGAVDKMNNFIVEVYKMASVKKETLLQTYQQNKVNLEQRKEFLQAEIQRLNSELLAVQDSLMKSSDNSQEIQTIDSTYNEFVQLHEEFKSNVNSIISYLNGL